MRFSYDIKLEKLEKNPVKKFKICTCYIPHIPQGVPPSSHSHHPVKSEYTLPETGVEHQVEHSGSLPPLMHMGYAVSRHSSHQQVGVGSWNIFKTNSSIFSAASPVSYVWLLTAQTWLVVNSFSGTNVSADFLVKIYSFGCSGAPTKTTRFVIS